MTHNPPEEVHWVSCLRENFTSSSDGEGLETGLAKVPRQPFTLQLLFSHLKKRGFDLEATHMSDPVKLEKLFALVSLAFLFSFGWGCQLRKVRKHNKHFLRKNIFRAGLEDILRIFSNQTIYQAQKRAFIGWLKSERYEQIFIV